MIKPKIIYIHQEQSGRASALIKHIKKYNPEYTIITNMKPNIITSYLGANETPKFLFLLNETAITNHANDYYNLGTTHQNLNFIFPNADQARLENSKLYCRQFLDSIHLGYLNPAYSILTSNTRLDKIQFANKVIKADGLAGGKGVYVHSDHFQNDSEASQIVTQLLASHSNILLEEKLVGEEFSCISLAWKGTITHFPLVRDFKRLLDGNQGANTGGMGTITFPDGSMPFITTEELAQCRAINETVIIESGFTGFLYASFMKINSSNLTNPGNPGDNLKIIEYNVRLGDSEAVNILALLDSSLIDFLYDPITYPLIINSQQEYTYFRYMVPRDYGHSSHCHSVNNIHNTNTHYLINPSMPEEVFYTANSILANPEIPNLYTIGKSRTCGVLTRGAQPTQVIQDNDHWVSKIYGDLFYRRDIGTYLLQTKSTTKPSPTHTPTPIAALGYIHHLDNYNHIITNTKARIDEHNLALSLQSKNKMNVIGRIGDFANSIEYDGIRMICSVDGAGTKTKFLEGHPNRFTILGMDIVSHNINDMFCNNGHPIAMLDYYGCDKLDKTDFNQFIEGVLTVCREYKIALIGGETAEMRGIFIPNEVEVLGILLGVLLPGQTPENGTEIQTGHIIYGLESHGAHTNGFTKLRDIDNIAKLQSLDGQGMPIQVKEYFCQPHRVYIPVVDYLTHQLNKYNIQNINKSKIQITGKAHITGGGFQDNITRILQSGMGISLQRWELDPAWQWVYEHANLEWDEFIRVFNAGWGFCIVTNVEIPEFILAATVISGYGKIKKIGWITSNST